MLEHREPKSCNPKLEILSSYNPKIRNLSYKRDPASLKATDSFFF